MQALRSLETGLDGWSLPKNWKRLTRQQVEYGLRVPNPERMLIVKQVTHPVHPSVFYCRSYVQQALNLPLGCDEASSSPTHSQAYSLQAFACIQL